MKAEQFLFYHFQDLCLGHCAHILLNKLSIPENHQRGNAHYAVPACQLRLLIHLDLAYLNMLMFFGNFLNQGKHHPARTAPGSPEIYQHRFFRLQYFSFKIFLIDDHS